MVVPVKIHEEKIDKSHCASRQTATMASVSSASGATVAVTPATVAPKSSKKEPKCMCKWDKCQELREQVLEVLPSDHPWVGAPLQVQSHGATLKKMALRHRVIELLIAENSDKRTLIIHRHHFSIVGWVVWYHYASHVASDLRHRLPG